MAPCAQSSSPQALTNPHTGKGEATSQHNHMVNPNPPKSSFCLLQAAASPATRWLGLELMSRRAYATAARLVLAGR